VVLDAAAHAPTHSLDLSRTKPDFVTISFYKMFGYPTGEVPPEMRGLSSTQQCCLLAVACACTHD
jgi:hypothetical protein